jgi:hypothetical protein
MSFVAVLGLQSVSMRHITSIETAHHMKFTPDKKTAHSEEAAAVWEQAIAAKGGRERLHSVRNIVITGRAVYRSRMLKKNQIQQEGLYLLPHNSWVWNDLRPDVFGLRVTMYNYDTKMKYVISEGEPHRRLEPITEADKTGSETDGLLSYLPETKWLTPVLIGSSTGRVRQRPVDIVETRVNGERVDFALDRKTHLPVRVSYYDVIKGKTYTTEVELSDYVEISGIKVPQKVKYEDGTEYEQTYQFNVDYNEDIFVRPTTIQAGPQAWKPKK